MELFLTIAWAVFVLATPLPISLYWATCLDDHTVQPPRLSIAKRALFCLTIWTFIQICIPLVMGMLGMFRTRYVLIAYVLILAICMSENIRHRIIAAIYDNLAILTREKISFQEATIVSLWMLLIVISLAINMATPITNYDSQAYHLPNMATWLQYGRFKMVDSSLLFQVNRYPYSWEAFSALLLMPFRSDILVSLPSIFSQVLLGLAVYCLARHLEVSRTNALFGSFLASSLPIEMEMLNSVQIDMAFAAFCLIAVHALLAHDKGWRTIYFLASSILIGIRMNGVLYVTLFATLAMITYWLDIIFQYNPHYQTAGVQSSIKDLNQKITTKYVFIKLAIIISCLFVSTFWYIINFYQVGNPLGYVPISIAKLKLLPGEHIVSLPYLKRTSLAEVMKCNSTTDWQIMLEELWRRFGISLPLMSLLAASSTATISACRNVRGKIAYLSVAGLLPVAIYLYWISPYSGASGSGDPSQWHLQHWFGWNLRFALFAVGLLAVLAARGAETLAIPKSVVMALTVIFWWVALSSVWSEITSWNIYIARILLISAPPVLIVGWLHIVRHEVKIKFLLVAVAIIFVGSLAVYIPFAYKIRNNKLNDCYFGIPKIIEKYSFPTDTVGYLGIIRILPIFGEGLQRRVVDLSDKASSYNGLITLIKRERIACIVAQRQPDEDTKRKIAWMLTDGFVLQKKFSQTHGDYLLKDSLLVFCR